MIEDFFPRNGVRYIAMNDGIDTLRDNNDIAPFKNILNEMYSKDTVSYTHQMCIRDRSYADRNTLWNAAEAVEKQWNSQLARRWVLTLSLIHI